MALHSDARQVSDLPSADLFVIGGLRPQIVLKELSGKS
jgi:hypothetical protein